MPSRTPLASSISLTGQLQDASDIEAQVALKGAGPMPVHVAVIMDGNGRWAKERGKSRVTGHREGIESVRDIVEACAQIGVRHLTLYTFSTENWQRPPAEVRALMELLVRTIRKEAERLHSNGIRIRTLGDLDRLPRRARAEMEEAMQLTAGNTRMDLFLALSYSGRWELARAAQRIAADVQAGRLALEDVTEEAVASRLETAGVPDPDLLIRTGGDLRISNFLLWQIAYAELYLTDTKWPAFRRAELYRAVADFQQRERRFGRVAS